jgi:phosphoglycolate phosphatase-like HAD superfamily hydrolase
VSEPLIEAFVFDMDGTILDNMGLHTAAWMQTIEELGQEPREPREWERATSGTPNHEIFRNLLGLHDLDDAGINHWVERKEGLYRVSRSFYSKHEPSTFGSGSPPGPDHRTLPSTSKRSASSKLSTRLWEQLT